MKARFRSSFTNEYIIDGVTTTIDWEIDLMDNAYGGLTEEIKTADEGVVIKYIDDDDPLYEALKASEVKSKFIIETSAQEIFFNAVATSVQEDRYYIKITKDGSLWWTGKIVQDLIRFENRSFPYVVDIGATDGIGLLKDKTGRIDYTGTLQPKNYLQYIITILKELDPQNVIGTSDPFLQTSIRWFEDQMYTTTPADTLDPLTRIRFQQVGFNTVTEGNSDDEGFRNWKDQLNELCSLMGARLMFSDGVWRLYQINALEDISVTTQLYSKEYDCDREDPTSSVAGLLSSGDATDLTPTEDYKLLANSGNTFLPALQEVKSKWDFNNYRGFGFILRKPTSDAPFEFGEIIKNSSGDTYIRVAGDFSVGFNNLSAAGVYYEIRAEITMIIDDGTTPVYLTNDSNRYRWSTNSADKYNVYSGKSGFLGLTNPNNTYQDFSLNFLTPNIPNGGDVSFEIELTPIIYGSIRLERNVSGWYEYVSTPITGSTYLYREIRKCQFDFEYSGNNLLTEKEFKSVNEVEVRSSSIYEFPDIRLGDGDEQWTSNKLEVYDPSGSWEDSQSWKVEGDGEGKDIHQLLCNEAIKTQLKPKKLYDFIFRGFLDFKNVLVYDGDTYVLNTIQYEINKNYIRAQGIQISAASSGFDEVSTFTVDDPFINIGSTPVGGAGAIFNGVTDDPLINNGTPLTTINGTMTGTITSIPVGALENPLLVSGDDIFVFDPASGTIEGFVLDADAEDGDTSISVVSRSISNSFYSGSRVYMPKQSLVRKANIRDSGKIAGLEVDGTKIGDFSSDDISIDRDNATIASKDIIGKSQRFASNQTISTTSEIDLDNGSIIKADASSGSITIDLPPKSSYDGVETFEFIAIIKSDSSVNTVTIDPQAGGSINGESDAVLSSENEKFLFLRMDGEDWIKF